MTTHGWSSAISTGGAGASRDHPFGRPPWPADAGMTAPFS